MRLLLCKTIKQNIKIINKMKSVLKSIVMGFFIGVGIFFMPFFILPLMFFFFFMRMMMFRKMRHFIAYQHYANQGVQPFYQQAYSQSQPQQKRQIEVL